jgi:hypothetical protein
LGHIDEKLLKIDKKPPGALSKLLLKPADIPESIEDLPDVLPLAIGRNIKQREQTKLIALAQDQYGAQRSE